MTDKEFEKASEEILKWIRNYLLEIEKYPVKSNVKYHEIFDKLPDIAPDNSEDFNKILDDFNKIIMPGITHWQSPNFFAYFPANSSYPSLLAEMIISTLAAQCMKWETSPSYTLSLHDALPI